MLVGIYLSYVPNDLSQEKMIRHFNKRGITTCYWAINHDDEIEELIKTSKVGGIMTDRPMSVLDKL